MTSHSESHTDVFLEEYTRDDIIAQYVRRSAGAGIAYALGHVYAPIYRTIISELMASVPLERGFTTLEYGCGGGMNLLTIIALLKSADGRLEKAYGTDFSAPMIEAARKEAALHLPPELNRRIEFVVAPNERLAAELAQGLHVQREELSGRFDLIVGVNTTRYGHRLGKERDCARDIFSLLRPGGYSVMIDMNQRFPLFRSKCHDVLTRPKEEYYIPSLEEYTRPFEQEGFEIRESRNFCWIPHSANRGLLAVCRAFSPLLDRYGSRFAMRSLVIGRKPR